MKVHLLSSFHYDNTWHMSSQDYAAFTREKIIKTVVDILKREEDFRFTIDHLTSLESFLEYYPEEGKYLREEMRKGRVEMVGPMYTQPDSLLVGGESLIRQCLYGAKWLKDSLGVKPTVEWLTDVYGYCNQIPQILRKVGIEHLVICLWWVRRYPEGKEYLKELPTHWDFLWEGIDGSRVVVHDSPDYGGLYLPGDEYIRSCPCLHSEKGNYGDHDRGKKNELIFSAGALEETKEAFRKEYEELKKGNVASQESLFMHMGGDFREPHLQNVFLLKELEKETDLPKMVFSTPSSYFKALQKSSLEVHRGELNPVYPGRFGEGYFETKTKIKQLNRQFESTVARAESLASMAYALGKKYPAQRIENAYKPFLFYQHHDPFIGNIPKDEYDLLCRRWRSSLAEVEAITKESLDYLLGQVKAEGEGSPLVIINPSSWSRSEMVQTSREFPPGSMELSVKNSTGAALPTQIKIVNRHPDGSIQKASLGILATDIPAYGYEVLRIVKGKAKGLDGKGLSVEKKSDHFRIENEFYCLEINQKGQLQSFYDKEVERQLLRTEEFLANEFILEEDLGCFCYIKSTGKKWREELHQESFLLENGPLFSRIVTETRIKDIVIKKEITLYGFQRRIDFQAKVHLPDGEDKRLRVIFPVNFNRGKIVAETPFAFAQRKEGISAMINWLDYSKNGSGLALFNQGIPSYEIKKDNIYLNLIKGLSLKDPMSSCLPPSLRKEMIERGDFCFSYALQSHGQGLSMKEVVKAGYEFNGPLLAADLSKPEGTLPSKFSFLSLEPGNLLIYTVKKAEQDDALIVRIYESEGKPRTLAQLRLSLPVKSCLVCNLLEEEERHLPVKDQTVEFTVKAHEIITLKLKIEKGDLLSAFSRFDATT